MNPLELSGILQRELSLKIDKNNHEYYIDWLKIKDGTIYTFFLFQLGYDLSMRLAELRINQTISLQGFWSKRNLRVFLANDFYLEEKELMENIFNFEYGL